MITQSGRKKFIGLTALSSVIVVEIFALMGLYILFYLQIRNVYNKIFIITIVFLLINIIIFVVCIFCIKSYQNIHRIFLLSIIVIYTITMACLSYFIYAFSDDFLDAISLIWDKGIQESINAIESNFNCKGFDKSNSVSSCYEPVHQYLQSKSKIYSLLLGFISCGYIILCFISFYFAYKSRHINGAEPDIMSLDSKDLNNIKQPLNLDATINI